MCVCVYMQVLGDLTIPTDYKRGDMKRQGVILQFVSPDIPDTLHKTVQRLSARVHATFYKVRVLLCVQYNACTCS